MNAYTYYEPVFVMGQPDQEDLLELWKSNWSKFGWTPVVLSHRNLGCSDEKNNFADRMAKFPTVNPTDYELACFLRWWAMGESGGGLMSDYDVINFGFTPEQCPNLGNGDTMTFFDAQSPSCVFGSAIEYFKICSMFESYVPDDKDVANDRPHVSDMTILNRKRIVDPHLFNEPNICVEFSDSRWKDAALVHFSAASVGKYKPESKADCVRRFMGQHT